MLINLFVLPIAMAGLLTFPAGKVDSDMFVLALPLIAKSDTFTLLAFVGGLSAATAMVIVETVALAIMVSNDIVMPWVLQRREALLSGRADVGALLLQVRRTAIVVILLLAYLYYRSAGEAQLAAIGLLAFAAVAQLAPAFFGGLFWRRGTARGAIAGMTIGILAWAYTLLLPTIADVGIIGRHILTDGPWGIVMLRPQALFGLDLHPLVHGVIWSLDAQRRSPTSASRCAASRPRSSACRPTLFVPTHLAPMTPSFRLWRSSVTVEELTTDGRALSRRGAHPLVVRELRRGAAHQPQPAARGRLPAAALRRASARLGDRRGVVAARAVAAAAQAHGVDQGRAQAARRRQRRDPLQPRNPADTRSTTCARASRCSTRTCGWSAGTGSSATSSTCRPI